MTGSSPSSSRVALFRVFIRRWFNWLVLGAMAGAILGAAKAVKGYLAAGYGAIEDRTEMERFLASIQTRLN